MRAVLLALIAVSAEAEPVGVVPYEDLEPRLVTRVDFEDFPRLLSPGTPLEGIQRLEGVRIGERFAGQTLSHENGFDRLSPHPLPPLSIVAGAPGQNLAVSYVYTLSNQVAGLAPPGFPERRAGGEGAIAILFDRDQFALGFRVAADLKPGDGTQGAMRVGFFRRDATPIASVNVTLGWGFRGYGFLREGEVSDIAGITITNADPAGIAIDDVIFDTDVVLGSYIQR